MADFRLRVNDRAPIRLRVLPSLLPREIELQNTGDAVQWRYIGEEWHDLIEIDDINATVTVGTVTTLPAGQPATVVNSGTDQDVVLDFGLPEGGVSSVNGEAGAVVLTAADIGSTATGDVAATNVQDAIAELASEKLSAAAADALFLTPAEGNAAYQPKSANLDEYAAVNPSAFGLARVADVAAEDARNALDTAPYVASRALLKALDTTKDTVAYLTESGREGTFVWRSGNYSAQITADTQEGIYVKATAIASSAGAWVRIYASGVYPEWFGAVGDNSTNDYAALQAALDFAIANKVPLLLGPKTYRCNSMLDAGQLSSAEGLVIRGADRKHSIIAGGHSGSVLRIGNSAATTFTARFLMADCQIAPFSGSTPSAGIEMYDVVRTSFQRVVVTGCTIGAMLWGGIAISFEDCDLDGNVTGIKADNFASTVPAGYTNFIVVHNSRILNNTTFGIDFQAGRFLIVEACEVEGNGTNGVNNSGGIRVTSDIGSEGSLNYAFGAIVRDCWFESNAGAASVHFLGGTNALQDGYFVANTNATYDIYIGGGAYRIDGTQHDSTKTPHIIDAGTTSTGNSIANARKADGTLADISIAGAAGRTKIDYLGLNGGSLSGVLGVADGAVNLPGLAFSNDLDNGLYRIGANHFGLSVGGAQLLDFAAGILGLSSGQLAFPSTQNPSANANTLDDYEEGTWTPAVLFGGASTGITYGTQSGCYVKIGALVFATARIILTSKGSATGTATLSGLPFANGAVGVSTNIANAANFTGLTGALAASLNAGASALSFLQWGSTGNNGLNTDAIFTNTTSLTFAVVYSVV